MADTRMTPTAGDPTAVSDLGAEGSTSRTTGILKAGKDEALTEAKQMMREVADEQRSRAAGALGGVAGALHKAAGDMTTENEVMGRYTHMAAERLDQVADYLRSTDWEDVLNGAEDMARRQPYWFVGGAMAAGFLLARMVKSAGVAQQRYGATSARYSQRLAASSDVGYGTSTEAGLFPAGSSTTAPLSSSSPSASTGAAATVTPRTEV